jgi:hypothetical protein
MRLEWLAVSLARHLSQYLENVRMRFRVIVPVFYCCSKRKTVPGGRRSTDTSAG